MAQVPGVPSPAVAPSATQQPFQRVDAPKAAFGAAMLGDAATNLGAAAGQVGLDLEQHAQKMAAIDNKLATDEADAAYMQFTDQHTTEFMEKNRGMNALAALPEAMKTLTSQRDAIADTLTNPTAKTMFLGASRQQAARTAGALSRFASSQREEALTAQYGAINSALMDDNFRNAGSPDFQQIFQQNAEKAVVAATFRAEHLGYSEDVAKQFARDAYGNLVKAQVQNLFSSGDVLRASAFLDDHKEGMNPTAYNQLAGQLKPALFANRAATLADQIVGETLGVRTPKADAMATLTAMRTDPIAAIRAATGVTVAKASGARTAQRNKEVGGSPTSEHLVNGAWDLQPPSGMSMVELAQKIHDSGIDYDQLEVQGNYVHVGFKPDGEQRGQIIGTLAGQVHNPSVNSALGGALTSYELKAKEGLLQDRLRARALAEQPGNMAYADMVVSRGITQLNQFIQARSYAEQDANQTLLGTIAGQDIRDLPTLLKIPGMAPLYNSLPQSTRTSLQGAMARDANQPTAERTDNYLKLYGMLHDEAGPNAFMMADIASMDLTNKDKLYLQKKQIDLRQRTSQMADSDKFVRSILGSPEAALVAKQMGITDYQSQEALRLKGAIAAQMDVWVQSNPGKPPSDKEKQSVLQQAQQYLLHPGVSVESMQSALGPPPPHIQDIMNRARAAGYPATQSQAYEIYARMQNAR